MTEHEWPECTEPEAILEFLRGKVSERKLRLFACACCRGAWSLLGDKRSRLAIRKVEEYADSLDNDKLRRDAYNIANAATKEHSGGYHATVGWEAAWAVACAAHSTIPTGAHRYQERALMAGQNLSVLDARLLKAKLLRDIFGNPFRPVSFNPAWQTPTVVSLAQAAYEERAMPSGELNTTRLAILADALEECGCNNADILTHLRSPNPHVRGCWVVDWVLAKE
jgi:hypothetical protein